MSAAAAVEAVAAPVTQHTSLCKRMDSSDRRYLLLEELPEETIQKISSIVSAILKKYISTLAQEEYVDYYTSKNLPTITFCDFAKRIIKHSKIDLCTLTHTIILITSYLQRSPERKLTEYNIHRLFATSIFLSASYCQDLIYDYNGFSQILGIPELELKKLVLDYAFKINFTLYFPTILFREYTSFKNVLLRYESLS